MSKVIRVRFSQAAGSEMPVFEAARRLSDKEYDYFLVRDEQDIRKGSLAVVEVAGILRIVSIVGTMARSSRASKYAITVFSLDEHKELMQRKEDIQTLRQAVFERAEEAESRRKLHALAADDSTLKTMLTELEALEGGSAV
jgi:hypothetical protein